ncbi:hypothetical protein JR316_0008555 [Psilocybe cubensis]|uniref:Uncharacterized protein n=2 Tax=Psilocybe cubensis TaxID=181762 RepID=A0ACB8GW32_PSICU|nr:hypothetical protein JR316_0008555 [Psilocybe cubensis]KAH9479958.1 hypothetical protein JR316_0008555 [Psilocybe cubensis]
MGLGGMLVSAGILHFAEKLIRKRELGLHILKQHIAADAIYDSAERFPPAQCHPGTRERIIEAIIVWVNEPNPDKQVLWLHGPPGAGKSAVRHSIATILQEMSGNQKYGSSFFFAKGAPGRGDGNKLFCTIAYELAVNFPSYRSILDSVMQENPTLPTKLVNIQLHNLLIRPLRKVSNWPSHHPTVIIDGFDECSGGNSMQVVILSTISNAIMQHRIPLRFLIISRAEYWIADAFETGCLKFIVKRLSLRDDHEADAGIRHYLCEEFNRIYNENIEVMHSTPLPWPEKHIIERFVASASGQYVYASTIIKFVGDTPHCDPLDQLRLLTTAGPHEAFAFSELDSLYAAILSSYPRWDTLKRVITAIVLRCTISEAVMEHIFNVPPAELRHILRSMRPVIHKTEVKCPSLLQRLESTFGAPAYQQQWLTFHHLSFKEFITDSSRSGELNISQISAEMTVWCMLIRHLAGLLQGDTDIEGIVTRISMSQYRHWLDLMPSTMRPEYFEHPPKEGTATMIQELKNLLAVLDILSQEDTYTISHADYTSLLLDKLGYSLLRLRFEMEKKSKKRFKPGMKLFKALSNRVKLALTISVQQVLVTTPMDGPVFGHLIKQSWVGPFQYFDIAEICNETNMNDETILTELQKINRVVTLCCTHDGVGQVKIIPHFFKHQIHTIPSEYTDALRVSAWEAQILANIASKFSDLGKRALHIEAVNYIHITAFLDNARLSDIRSQHDLDDANRMTILNILNGPNRLVFEENDYTMIGKMEAAVKATFSALLPLYIEASTHCTALRSCCFTFEDLSVHLSAKPDGTYLWSKEKVSESTYGAPGLWIHLIDLIKIASENWHIVPADLYPHFSSFLLKGLSGVYYSILHPEFKETYATTASTTFQKLIWWMPHAIPTEDNLNMIRLMHYLWHKMDHNDQPIPPPRLCNLTMDFLTVRNLFVLY